MNKKPILLIVSLLGGLSLSSCECIKPVETVKIDIWAPKNEEQVINAVIEDWNSSHSKKYQFSINFTAIAEADCATKLINEDNINEPALFLSADDFMFDFIKKDILYQVEESIKEDICENSVNLAIKGFTYQDNLYAYPINIDNGYFMWYNKKILSEENVKSFETILKVAKETNTQIYYDLCNGWFANDFIMSPQACGLDSLKWYKNNEGKVYYETTWDNEEGVKVSHYINSLINNGDELVNYQFHNSWHSEKMEKQQIIAGISGIWIEETLEEYVGDNLAACKLPEYHIDGKSYQMASFGGSKGYFVNKNKSEQEVATANLLAQLLTNKEAQLTRFELNKKIPSNKKALVDNKFIDNASIGEKAFIEQAEFACVQSHVAESRYWDIGKKIGEAYVTENFDKNTWAEFLKQQMDELRTPKEEIIYG